VLYFFEQVLAQLKKKTVLCTPFLTGHKNFIIMSKICQITGKKVITGNNVSHSNRKTRRTFEPNLQMKRFFVPEMDQWITLKVSAAGLRTINKVGIYNAIQKAADQGFLFKS
jgi:large subunit ribosomal protein L28